MKKREFSLPMNFGKIKITGRPINMWNCEESCLEFYDILNELTMGIINGIKERIVAEELAKDYTINELANLIKDNSAKYKQTYDNPKYDVSCVRLNTILKDAIKIREDPSTSF